MFNPFRWKSAHNWTTPQPTWGTKSSDTSDTYGYKSPYVKEVDDSAVEPVIPSEIEGIKICRYRQTKDKWQHLPQKSLDRRESPTDVRIITWKISQHLSHPEDRLAVALAHIAEELGCGDAIELSCANARKPPPCVICLQEVHVRALQDELVQNAWVRAYFCVLPHKVEKWGAGAKYGNVTLVSRDVPVEKAAILRFGVSSMKRTAVIAHLLLRAAKVREGAAEPRELRVAVINTQLESSEHGTVYRPRQLDMLAAFLKQKKDGVNGGVIVGDMNAESRADRLMPDALGLKDAWKRGDEDEEGCTWGYNQPASARVQFPPMRMDKMLFSPRRGLKVDEPTRIGVGVTYNGSPVSEHYGLISTLRMLK
ncbi:hypothetical protein BD626DRAFT_399678 [Schizophyllum amplum]|uniref:Endonuclease/exonuclease/phosphatase domain-containing protein n=1 Tax=Schizophyllum amplum TaxID=97359 RepID=A0A550CIP4_9AGAR|nr:hypothetical protein BD626DRAFT_399678 [Auriculariopsis ampla]